MSNAAQPAGSAWTSFDWSRERYEGLIRRVVPEYDRQAGLIAEAIAPLVHPPGGAPFRILDLGAGTGLLSLHLLQRFPMADVVAIDLSAVMVDECRRTLAGHGARARVVKADFAIVGLTAADDGMADLDEAGGAPPEAAPTRPAFDAVVSRLAIHHLDDRGKAELARRVFAALRGGGIFVNSDMIAGRDEAESATLLDEWRSYMRARGDDPAEWEQWLTGEHDHPATEQAHLGWLRTAGFQEVRTIWKVAGFAAFRAVKPHVKPPEE